MATALFTIGYEGRQLDELIASLVARRIDRVIDVRDLPLSRRRGFSKTPLRDALAQHDIEYVHVREAGNPYRREKDTIPRAELLARYRAFLTTTREPVARVTETVDGHRAVLLCFEADPATCHRSIIGARVARKLGVRITNL